MAWVVPSRFTVNGEASAEKSDSYGVAMSQVCRIKPRKMGQKTILSGYSQGMIIMTVSFL